MEDEKQPAHEALATAVESFGKKMDAAVATPVPKPATVFPCRIWHKAGTYSARLVSSPQEIRALGDEWTLDVPKPKQPAPLGETEHAKRVVPHN